MTKEQFLQSTIDYYSVDPKNRRCTKVTKCAYSPKSVEKVGISEGCAIGRHLSPEVQEQFDNNEGKNSLNLTIYKIMEEEKLRNLLPDWMQEMDKDFLSTVQSFHDGDQYWTDNGLSNHGIKRVNRIISDYNLSMLPLNDVNENSNIPATSL